MFCAITLSADKLDGGKGLLAGGLEITIPVLGFRPQHAVPRGIRQPEEGLAIGVCEGAAVLGEAQRTVLSERIVARVGDAPKAALVGVEACVGGGALVGAGVGMSIHFQRASKPWS